MGEKTVLIRETEIHEPGRGEVYPDRPAQPRTGYQPPGSETEQIREQIEETRGEMSETINAIQERLSPGHIKDEIKGAVRNATVGRMRNMMNSVSETYQHAKHDPIGTARQAGSSIAETIRDNPIPAAMIGIGLGWLLVKASRGDSAGSYRPHRYAEPYEPVYETERTSQAREKAEEIGRQVRDKARQVGAQAREKAEQVGGQVQSVFQDKPLIVGALSAAVGAAVGFALPETRTENRLMGEANDRLMRKFQQTAEGTIEKVQHVAEEAGRKVQQEAERQGLTR